MPSNIRNFVITAHIDHGKSTLADRMLEITKTIEKRLMKEQVLDQMDLERERGITIKMAPVRMNYKNKDGEYILNLIDTPGHSDFGYEVSRALAAVEGAVLLVDATQGVQAQTLANFENAKKSGLKIIGAVNKVDMAQPDQIDDAIADIAELLETDSDKILKVSGKTGLGVEELLAEVVKQVPPPTESDTKENKALVFDSIYDEHKGIMAFVRVFSGQFNTNDTVKLLATNTSVRAKEIGFFAPTLKPGTKLQIGEIGYIATGIKDPDKLKIGDTIAVGPARALAGYLEPRPVVFVSFYPEESDKYDEFKYALGKLRLTDAALVFEPDSSEVLGRGFKGGFLGQLHFEITAERLAREFKIETVHSFPSVAYKVDGQLLTNPKDFPDDYGIAEEPMTRVEIVTPAQYLGSLLRLQDTFRFSNVQTETLKNKVVIKANLPLADLIRDLDDRLKSVSQGFASFYYEIIGFEKSSVAKLEILIAGHVVPGLTRILPKKDIEREARVSVEKLKELLPKQQFMQAIQAQAGNRIIARESIAALKKDVAGYLYGGDRTRKMKLWKKQQRGKKKLKEMAGKTQVKVPSSVFKELLKK